MEDRATYRLDNLKSLVASFVERPRAREALRRLAIEAFRLELWHRRRTAEVRHQANETVKAAAHVPRFSATAECPGDEYELDEAITDDHEWVMAWRKKLELPPDPRLIGAHQLCFAALEAVAFFDSLVAGRRGEMMVLPVLPVLEGEWRDAIEKLGGESWPYDAFVVSRVWRYDNETLTKSAEEPRVSSEIWVSVSLSLELLKARLQQALIDDGDGNGKLIANSNEVTAEGVAPIVEREMALLSYLREHNERTFTATFLAAVSPSLGSRTLIGQQLERLREAGYVHYPRGKRQGAAATKKGLKLLDVMAPVNATKPSAQQKPARLSHH